MNDTSLSITIAAKASQHDCDLLVARLSELNAEEQFPGHYTRGIGPQSVAELRIILSADLDDPEAITVSPYHVIERSDPGPPRADIILP